MNWSDDDKEWYFKTNIPSNDWFCRCFDIAMITVVIAALSSLIFCVYYTITHLK